MSSDFLRPNGIDSGVLINTNNEALQSYKKMKKRMSKLDSLQQQYDDLNKKFDLILELLSNRDNN